MVTDGRCRTVRRPAREKQLESEKRAPAITYDSGPMDHINRFSQENKKIVSTTNCCYLAPNSLRRDAIASQVVRCGRGVGAVPSRKAAYGL